MNRATSCSKSGVYHLFATLALLGPAFWAAPAQAQGQAIQAPKVELPPPPNFDIKNAPEQYPDGTMSIYGLRRKAAKFMDKDVQLKGYLVEIYECPAELRKCNDALQAKTKKDKKSGKGLGGPAPLEPVGAPKGGCRPCDQPHFYMADSPTAKRRILVADYPVKDWETGKPKPLTAPLNQMYVVTGTFAINSIGGFADSEGLIIHKKLQDEKGAVLAEGNAVLPPEAQDIKLDGKAVEKVGGMRIDAEKGDKAVPR